MAYRAMARTTTAPTSRTLITWFRNCAGQQSVILPTSVYFLATVVQEEGVVVVLRPTVVQNEGVVVDLVGLDADQIF